MLKPTTLDDLEVSYELRFKKHAPRCS